VLKIRHCANRQTVVRHTEKAHTQTVLLVFADTKANPSQNQKSLNFSHRTDDRTKNKLYF
jgi:hypothetical protein